MRERIRNTLVLVATLAQSASLGCASVERLSGRVQRLEQELADIHQNQRRLDSRLDEIQIALNTLQSRLGGGAPAPAKPAAAPVAARPPRTAAPAPAPAPARARDQEKPLVLRLDGREPRSGEGSLRVEPEVSAPDEGGAVEIGLDAQAITDQFQAGMGLYRSNHLERARDAFEAFARRFPEHELTPDAIFFGGQARLQLGDTQAASQRFSEVATRYPRSGRAAEALLHVARCQERLGQSDRARSTYLQLVDAYPLSVEASEANRRLSMIR